MVTKNLTTKLYTSDANYRFVEYYSVGQLKSYPVTSIKIEVKIYIKTIIYGNSHENPVHFVETTPISTLPSANQDG